MYARMIKKENVLCTSKVMTGFNEALTYIYVDVTTVAEKAVIQTQKPTFHTVS